MLLMGPTAINNEVSVIGLLKGNIMNLIKKAQ